MRRFDFDGLPYYTDRPDHYYKRDDPWHKKPQVATTMHADLLCLSNVEDLKKYQEVLNECAAGRAYISSEDRQYDDSIKNWRILLVWGEIYLVDPEMKKRHEYGNQSRGRSS